MHDDDAGRDRVEPPEPPVVDAQDWPARSRTNDAREQLDRDVGTLGVGGVDEAIAAGDDDASRGSAAGSHEVSTGIGTGVAGRGEDVITRGEAAGTAANPGSEAPRNEPETSDGQEVARR